MCKAIRAPSLWMVEKQKARPAVESKRASVKNDAPILPRNAQEAIFAFGAVAACYAVLVIAGALMNSGVI